MAFSKFKKGKKPNAKGRNDQQERFTRLTHQLLTSEAFRSLDLVARALFVELCMMENGKNNGSLWLSVRDAADRLGLVDARAVMRGFEDLQTAGFIRMTKDAHFTIKAAETSRARCWALTSIVHGGKPPTNDWRGYAPPPKSKGRLRADRGLRAMARYRKDKSLQKLPVVEFTAFDPHNASFDSRSAVNLHGDKKKSDADQPNSVPVNSTAYIADTRGVGDKALSGGGAPH